MTKHTVSVIIPCYNAEKYIAKTIESVLSQSFSNVEIITIDDGSTDNTLDVLKKYLPRIVILQHEDGSNHGQAAALNIGIQLAKGEYVAFLDSDDLWHPDKLRKQVDVLDRYKDVGLVYTNGHVIGSDGNILYTLFDKDHYESNEIGNVLLNCYIRTPSLVMVRRSLLQAAGPFTVGIIPDQDMWVRIKEISNFYYLNTKLVSYRQHPDQISFTKNNKMWEDALWVLNDAMKRYPYPAWIRNKRLAVIHYRLGKFCLRIKAYPSAIGHFINSCWYDPSRTMKYIIKVVTSLIRVT